MTARPFWLALTAFALLGAAWAFALPVDGTYDESHHIARAYAVFSGQWVPPAGEGLRIPKSLLPPNAACTWYPGPPQPASCQQRAEAGGTADGPSDAARYPPAYYLLVGAPLRVAPNETGIHLSRLLSVLLNAILLAAAIWVAARLRHRLLMVGVVLVATPTVMNLAGAINPNGLEISAAVLLFVSLLAVVASRTSDEDDSGRRPLLVLSGIAAILLLTVRSLGPLLLLIDLLAIGVAAGSQRVLQQVRRRETWSLLFPFVAAGAVAAVVWLVLARSPVTGNLPGPLPDRSAGDFVDGILTFRIPFYVRQLVGQFGYGETTMSPLAVLLWYGLIATVVVPAPVRSARRVKVALGMLVVVSLALLVTLELAFIHAHRWYAHGRYALPLLVGVVLIAAWAQSPQPRRFLPAALVAAAAPVHLYALTRVMTRYQVSIDASLNPLGGTWHPEWGSVLPLVCATTGAVALVAVVWPPCGNWLSPSHDGAGWPGPLTGPPRPDEAAT